MLPKTLNTNLNVFIYVVRISRLRKAYTYTLIPIISISIYIYYIRGIGYILYTWYRVYIYLEFLSYPIIKNRFILP